MAPKRSRIEVGGSSQPDFDVGFDERRFVSSVAQAEYNRLRLRAIAKERGFKPTLNDGELVAMIEEKRWQVICEEPESVPMSIVREFYANAKIEKNGYSMVRGVVIDYQPAAIRQLLRQPAKPEGVVDWVLKTRQEVDLDNIVAELCVPGTAWKCKAGTDEHQNFQAKTMNRYARAWNLFICANLMPSSHTHDITVERAILLWGILTDEYVDLGYLIHQNMIKFMHGLPSVAIPHASIITRLCVAAGITWDSTEQVQLPSAPIDGSTIERMDEWSGGIPHHRGLGYIIEDAEERDPPQRQQRAPRGARGDRAGPSRVRTVMTSSQHRRLRRQVDTVNDRTARFATDMINVLDGMFADMGFQPNWPTYGQHHPYPAPDSPPEEGDTADQ